MCINFLLCLCRNRTHQRLQSLSGGQEPRRETVSTPHPQRPSTAQLLLQEHGGTKNNDSQTDQSQGRRKLFRVYFYIRVFPCSNVLLLFSASGCFFRHFLPNTKHLKEAKLKGTGSDLFQLYLHIILMIRCMCVERVLDGCNHFPPLPTGCEVMLGKVHSPRSVWTLV